MQGHLQLAAHIIAADELGRGNCALKVRDQCGEHGGHGVGNDWLCGLEGEQALGQPLGLGLWPPVPGGVGQRVRGGELVSELLDETDENNLLGLERACSVISRGHESRWLHCRTRPVEHHDAVCRERSGKGLLQVALGDEVVHLGARLRHQVARGLHPCSCRGSAAAPAPKAGHRRRCGHAAPVHAASAGTDYVEMLHRPAERGHVRREGRERGFERGVHLGPHCLPKRARECSAHELSDGVDGRTHLRRARVTRCAAGGRRGRTRRLLHALAQLRAHLRHRRLHRGHKRT
mmetsp:Transcript_22858/g.71554  ORF Transcript_22858/g.71554 Transcript_22858/m.71554 type:complete len:291 (+) Transcript_22858:472-1344(+)